MSGAPGVATPNAAVSLPFPPERVKLLGCAAVIDTMAPMMPSVMPRATLDFGLHRQPASISGSLQAAIDSSADLDAIVLGYGLCSLGVLGVRATHCRLVLPDVHDCIALFLGSQAAVARHTSQAPGTYFLTRSWIEAGGSPLQERERLVRRLGTARADEVMRLMYHNYTRLALITFGGDDPAPWRAHARDAAAQLGLRYEEIAGSTALMHKMVNGPWDDECIVIEPGDSVRLEHFRGLCSQQTVGADA